MNQNPEIEKLNKKAKEYSKMLQGIHAEMSKVIVGQDAVIENLILALATQGHVLLKGVPGLAKTLLIRRFTEGAAPKTTSVVTSDDLMGLQEFVHTVYAE